MMIWSKRCRRHLKVSGKIFVQTDVEFLAEEMFEIFRAEQKFARN